MKSVFFLGGHVYVCATAAGPPEAAPGDAFQAWGAF